MRGNKPEKETDRQQERVEEERDSKRDNNIWHRVAGVRDSRAGSDWTSTGKTAFSSENMRIRKSKRKVSGGEYRRRYTLAKYDRILMIIFISIRYI